MNQSNYQYSIEELSSICQKSKQSIYNLIKQNQEFIKDNSKRYGRRIKYNQEVLNYLLEYYGMESSEHHQDTQSDESTSSTRATLDASAEGKIEALKAEIDRLVNLLEETEAERKELLKQNGALILTLQQEKQEKQLYLPAPKKTITERIKGLFSK